MDDCQLLREYVERRSEAAFEGLVKRHVDMVFSTALRLVRDPHLAEDVTQAVFILLSRKAGGLKPSIVLGGWLYRTASLVAKAAIRHRVRQGIREREAAAMTSEPESGAASWESIAHHLDAAIAALGKADRDAVVMRYLQKRSFREVANALGVSEDAAKKRVARAIDKLRGQLASHGAVFGTAALGTLLSAHALVAAPATVIGAAAKAGLPAAAAGGGTGIVLAGLVVRETIFTRLKWAALIGATASLSIFLALQENHSNTENRVLGAASQSPSQLELPGSLAELAFPPDETAPPAAPPSGGMRLRVISATTDFPLPDAKGRVRFTGPDSVIAHSVADQNGVLEITRPDRRFEGMAIWVSAPAHVPTFLVWKREEEHLLSAEHLIRLRPGAFVGGRVVDESGQPVAGATLRFNGDGSRWNARDTVDYRSPATTPITDPLGRWSADFLDPQRRVWGGYASHPEFAETEFRIEHSPASATNSVITMMRGATVWGRVEDANGSPVADARLTMDWQYSARTELTARSDDEGWFTFTHVVPGPFRLKALAEGYQELERWTELSAEGLNLTVTLDPKPIAGNATLAGKVVDESGNPLAGVHVHLSHGQPALEGVIWNTRTDHEGRFRWNEAPDSVTRLTFGRNGYETLNVGLAPGETEHVITLAIKRTPEIHCTVTDQLSGNLLPSFKVLTGTLQQWSKDRDILDVRFLMEGTNGSAIFSASAGMQGRDSVVYFEAPGYLSETVALPEKIERDLILDIRLEPSEEIQGVVLTPQGGLAAGAYVAMSGRGLNPKMQEPGVFLLSGLGSQYHGTVAGQDGSFRLAPRREGEQLVVAHPTGWAVAMLPDFSSGWITLQPWGRIEGVLRRGSSLASNETIRVWGEKETGQFMSFSFTTKTDSSGKFVFEQVPGGRVEVCRQMITPFSRNEIGYLAMTQQQAVHLRAGETVHVELGGTGVLVKGRLLSEPRRDDIVMEFAAQNLIPAGAVPDFGTVPRDSFGFFCHPDGSFAVEDVAAGVYELHVTLYALEDRYNPDPFNARYKLWTHKVEVRVPEGAPVVEVGDVIIPAPERK